MNKLFISMLAAVLSVVIMSSKVYATTDSGNPLLGEIKWVAFNFTPRGWASCDGALLPINQYQALFSLLGTTYGGDGRTNFALPDLRGRVMLHKGQSAGTTNKTLGQRGGEESHQLTQGELPSHSHGVQASSSVATSTLPHARVPATTQRASIYADSTVDVNMDASAIGQTGAGSSHYNLMPSSTLNCIIALVGQFPSRN